VDWGVVVEAFAAGGGPAASFAKLAADASNRTYWRAFMPDGSTAVVMQLADDPLKSEEVVDGERPRTLPFLEVAAYLAAGGVPVPAILHPDLAAGVVILEDLGDVTVERALASGADKRGLYLEAARLLAAIQAYTERHRDDGCIAFRRRFGDGLLRWEFEHFYEWGLVEWTGRTPAPSERATLDAFFAEVVRRLTALPYGFVHRDYQSRNLMVKDGRLRLIDFQDALLGPYLYDLVALLRDSYVAFTPDEVRAVAAEYRAARLGHGLWAPSQEELLDAFHLQALQRKLKDSGRFVYIDRVKKNPKFLPNIPRSLGYAREAIDRFPEFAAAREVLASYLPESFA
jgi:aminoglycoside/choline kinase family phosphotransferase